MNVSNISRIILNTEATVADPAHLIDYSIPYIGMFSGRRLTRLLIKLLVWSIKRDIKGREYCHTNDWKTEKERNNL